MTRRFVLVLHTFYDKLPRTFRMLAFPFLLAVGMLGWTMIVAGEDQDQLQHLDELNRVWVGEWRSKVME